MKRRSSSTGDHPHPGLDLDFAPFAPSDFEAFSAAMAPTPLDQARFEDSVPSLNNAARAWRYWRYLELAPTVARERATLQALERTSGKLVAQLSGLRRFEPGDERPSARSRAHDRTESVPYDPEAVRRARASGSTRLPKDFPEDPTADARDDLPWLLDRMRHHFEYRYRGDPPQPKPIELTNEAILEFQELLRSFHAALGDRLDDLQDETPDPDKSAGIPVPIPAAGRSANQQLLVELVPIYEDLFRRKLGRSTTVNENRDEHGKPMGPALLFYRFIFSKLAIAETPTDHTISTWIKDWLADSAE